RGCTQAARPSRPAGSAASGRALLLFLLASLGVADRRRARLGHPLLLQTLVGLGILDRRALPLSGHSAPPLLIATVTFAPIMTIKPRSGQQQSRQKAMIGGGCRLDQAMRRRSVRMPAMMTSTQKPTTTPKSSCSDDQLRLAPLIMMLRIPSTA